MQCIWEMPVSAEQRSVGQLLSAFRDGSREAADRLVEVLYPELKRLAAAKMRRERMDHTWQPTALVNELYLELLKAKALGGKEAHPNDRKVFFGLAGHMMMRLLIHHARPLARRIRKISMDELSNHPESGADGLGSVERVLSKLASVDPELRSIVEMKVFEGLSGEEIASRLGCSTRTVERRWNFAKHWLSQEIS